MTFYYCLFITALFLFLFIFLRACIFTSSCFFIVSSACVCACVFRGKKYARFFYRRDIFIARKYDNKEVAKKKKDKATECLESFAAVVRFASR